MGISQTELRDIMAKNAAPMLLYARQLLDYHAAEEVVQDAFFRLSQEKTTIENPTAWLYRTVRNGAISRKRSDARRENRENDKQRVPWFETDLTDRLDAELVAETLQTLPPELREIVTLHVWGELSFAEIAELTGMSKATAFRRYEEGLATLRKRIRGDNDE